MDFVVAVGDRIIPVEVKSGAVGSLRSLREFCRAKAPSVAIRLDISMPSTMPLDGWSGSKAKTIDLISLPLYMASEIKRIVTGRGASGRSKV